MKTKLLLPLILIAVTAQAHLLDLTPGGFRPQDDIDPILLTLDFKFLDSAAHGWFSLPEGIRYLDGWVNRFGRLNGNDWFGTDLFGHDTPFASVSWDMANQPDGFRVTYILVEGEGWAHLYRTSGSQVYQGEGIVMLNGDAIISSISFFGVEVPDTGATLFLFGLALGGLTLWQRKTI